jgi:hypothetical protein
LQAAWVEEMWLNGPKGSAGRVFLRLTAVGASDVEGRASCYVEFNPAAMTAEALAGVGVVVAESGGVLDLATVHRFDATRDFEGRSDGFVLDDRSRRATVHLGGHRETHVVGAGGPLRAMLYDKRKEQEFRGISCSGERTRLEFQVRPSAFVDGDCEGQRVRIPQDRTFGGLGAWPFPAKTTKLRRVDPASAGDDVLLRVALVAVQCAGVRAVQRSLRDEGMQRWQRSLLDWLPVVDVERDWPVQWPAAISLLRAALRGEAWGFAERWS